MNTTTISRSSLAAVAGLALIAASPALATSDSTDPFVPAPLWQESGSSDMAAQSPGSGARDDGVVVQERPDTSLSASLGALYQTDADIDGGNNDFSVTRIAGALRFETVLTETSRVGVSVGYGLASYDFGGTTGFYAGNPWDDIHTITAGAIFQLEVANDWILFGGPTVQSSSESGADFGDGLTGGGIFGASWTASERLTLGLGVGIMSEIDDDARVFPVFRLHWQINDRWSLTSRASGNLITPTFVQLGYDLTQTVQLSVGGGYLYRRFALDNTGPAPGGVGEDEALAINFAARWSPSSTFTFTGVIGATVAGQLKTESTAGVTLSQQDYDPGLFIGALGTIRF